MLSSIIFLVTIALLCSQFECRFYYKSKFIRRQDQQMFQNPQQVSETSYPVQPVPPSASPMNPSLPLNVLPPASSRLPPGYPGLSQGAGSFQPQNAGLPLQTVGLSYGPAALPLQNAGLSYRAAGLPFIDAGVLHQNVAMQSRNGAVPHGSANFTPQNAGFFQEAMTSTVFTYNFGNKMISASTDVANYSQSVPSHLYENTSPMNINSRRRRRNVPEKNNELVDLFEKGKRLLEVSTEIQGLSKNGYLKYANTSLVDDLTDSNTTVIPIPKGVQLKTVSKYNDSKVQAAVNITSNTQKTMSVDNSTEIENVVEMQMEKKIEDEKGANKGSEEVRIVETERVKPLFNKSGNTSAILVRKRKSYKKRFATHRRSKRSTSVSDEIPRSKFVYNKMAHRFLSVVRRKERVVEPSNFSNRHKITAFRNANRRESTENVKLADNDLVYDKAEVDDFMKFFLKQMKKFRKSRENNNNTKPLRYSCNEERCNNLTVTFPKGKKVKKNAEYPEHMNIFMNLNMTWDSKMKEYASKSLKVLGVRRNLTENSGVTSRPLGEFTTQQKVVTLVYVGERIDTRFFTTVLFFSAMTFLLTLSTLVLPKLYRMVRLRQVSSGVEAYRFCDADESDNIKIKTYKYYGEGQSNKIKEPENDNLSIEDYPKLEWQCENGKWLS